jgi:hypothetical protein
LDLVENVDTYSSVYDSASDLEFSPLLPTNFDLNPDTNVRTRIDRASLISEQYKKSY